MSSPESFFSILMTYQYLAVAAETLLVYDYFLTFRLELDHIWHSRWSAVKVIFLLSRYSNLIGQSAYTLEILGVLSHGSSQFCARFEGFIVFHGLLQMEAIRILVLLRAWAIWGCKRYVAILLILAYAVYISVVSGMLLYILVIRGAAELPFTYLAETGACVLQQISNTNTDKNYNWIMPSTALLLDGIVSFMVALSLRKLFKETECLNHPRSLIRVLAMDATLYFAANLVTSVVNILSQTVFEHNQLTNIQLVCNPLVVVTGQRVVLNLRSMQSLPYSQQVFDLNLITDPSSLSRSVEDSHLNDDPLAQEDLDRRDHERANGIEMLDIPVKP